MGVERTDYLMFGIDIPGTLEIDDFQSEIDGEDDRRFDIVYDGMSGQYALAGKIVATSDPYEGFEMAEIDPKELDVDRQVLAEKVSAAFGRVVRADEFKLILFSHFH